MTTILDYSDAIERATGKHPLTPRWVACHKAFYGLDLTDTDVDNLATSTRRTKEALRGLAKRQGINRRQFRELWARVGRRGRKSLNAALIAIFEATQGGHEAYLLQGERGLIAVISKDTAGANIVARFVELCANALRIPCRWTTIGNIRVLDLEGFSFGIACFPCSATAPRGYAIPVLILDEFGHFATDPAQYLNAQESVLAAAKPAMAQFPDSKLIVISTPLGKDGLFHDTVEANLGDDSDPDVLAVEGPTWEWNPEISEARTHQVEKNPSVHAREFGAKAQDMVGAAWPSDILNDAFRKPDLEGMIASVAWAVADPSSGRHDAWVSMVCRFYVEASPQTEFVMERKLVPLSNGQSVEVEEPMLHPTTGEPIPNPLFQSKPPRPPLLVVEHITAHEGNFWSHSAGATLVAEHAQAMRRFGVTTCFADQREELMLASAFRQHGIHWYVLPWSNPTKTAGVERLRQWLRERTICLPDHPTLKKEMLNFKERILPSGGITWDGGKVSDDFVSCLVTAGIADSGATNDEWGKGRSLLPSSPLGPQKLTVDQRFAIYENYERLRALGFNYHVDELGQLHQQIPPR